MQDQSTIALLSFLSGNSEMKKIMKKI